MLRIKHPLRLWSACARIRHHPHHLTNLSPLDHFSQPHAQREEPRPHRLHQEDALLPGRGREQPRLCCVDRERLLAEDRLAGAQTFQRRAEMVRVRRGQVHNIDVRVRRQCCVGAMRGRLRRQRQTEVGNEGGGTGRRGGGGDGGDFVGDVASTAQS